MTVLNPVPGKTYIFNNAKNPNDPDNGKTGVFRPLKGFYALLRVAVPNDAADGTIAFPDDPGGEFLVWADELTEVE